MDQEHPMVQASLASQATFTALVAVLIVLFVRGVRRVARAESLPPGEVNRRTVLASCGALTVLVATGIAAESGYLASLANTPQFALYFVSCAALGIGLAFSKVGLGFAKHVPIAALVGFQAFRLPLELILHRWYVEGVIPVQMTYEGQNFDIISGILGVVAGCFLVKKRMGNGALWLVNAAGFGLLLAVIRVALLSSPVPIRSFHNEPALLLGLHAPYTWIVPFCVIGALFGHLVVFRYLWLARKAA